VLLASAGMVHMLAGASNRKAVLLEPRPDRRRYGTGGSDFGERLAIPQRRISEIEKGARAPNLEPSSPGGCRGYPQSTFCIRARP
jgi:hypothetical protein